MKKKTFDVKMAVELSEESSLSFDSPMLGSLVRATIKHILEKVGYKVTDMFLEERRRLK